MDVEPAHPASSLYGAKAFVACHTERYNEFPVVVRGADADGAVTADGVLADTLRLAQNIGGRS